jgi:hypothetical protein
MSLKITDDNLKELDDFLRSHQSKSTDWYVFVHDKDYVELDEHCVWIKIPKSCYKVYTLWSEGLKRFVNDNDLLKVNPNLLKNLNGMSRLFKDCKIKLSSNQWDLHDGTGFYAVKAFENTRFKGKVRDITITSDRLDATRMFVNTDIESVAFIDTNFLDMTELFLECNLESVLFKNCKYTNSLAEDVSCRDIFTDSMIKKIVFVDCESKLIDSIMYTLNGNNEFSDVEVYIEEGKK